MSPVGELTRAGRDVIRNFPSITRHLWQISISREPEVLCRLGGDQAGLTYPLIPCRHWPTASGNISSSHPCAVGRAAGLCDRRNAAISASNAQLPRTDQGIVPSQTLLICPGHRHTTCLGQGRGPVPCDMPAACLNRRMKAGQSATVRQKLMMHDAKENPTSRGARCRLCEAPTASSCDIVVIQRGHPSTLAHSYLALVLDSSTPAAAAGSPLPSESTLRSSRVRTRGVTGLEPPCSLPPPEGVPFRTGDAIGFDRMTGFGLDDSTLGLPPLVESDDRLNIPPIRDRSDRDVDDCGMGACIGSAVVGSFVSTGAADDASVTASMTDNGASRLSGAGVSTSIAPGSPSGSRRGSRAVRPLETLESGLESAESRSIPSSSSSSAMSSSSPSSAGSSSARTSPAGWTGVAVCESAVGASLPASGNARNGDTSGSGAWTKPPCERIRLV